jgi:hypothetical protein
VVITETAPAAGWSTSISCSDNLGNTWAAPGSKTITIPRSDLNNSGQVIVCSVTNTVQSATMRLAKTWVDAITGDTIVAETLGLTNNATLSSTADTPNETDTGAAVMVYAGETATLPDEDFTVGTAANYATSAWVCDGSDADPSDGLTIGAADVGNVITCTVTNTRASAQLTLRKTWVDGAANDTAELTADGINDATNVLTAGQASMMMNWPFMWVPAQDPETSKIVGKVGTAVLPAGPAGTASIDGTDAYTIASNSPDPELTRELIEFYLDKEVQKRQVLDTGWLPIRLSVLNDPEVQATASNAAVVLEQAKAPYDSFVTPDYNEVTDTMGREIQKALQGSQTAAETMAISEQLVTDIVKKRTG